MVSEACVTGDAMVMGTVNAAVMVNAANRFPYLLFPLFNLILPCCKTCCLSFDSFILFHLLFPFYKRHSQTLSVTIVGETCNKVSGKLYTPQLALIPQRDFWPSL